MVTNLGIIIPTHKRSEKLKRLLNSIKFSKEDINNITITTYVISNGFSKKDQTITTLFENCEYGFSNGIGVNKARNKGIQNAKDNEFLIFLDDDCVIENASFFTLIISHFMEKPETDVLGGSYISPPNASNIDLFYNNLCKQWIHHTRIGQNHWTLLGGCLAIRTKLLNSGIIFNEDIKYGSSETELLFRLNQLNVIIDYSKNIRVYHSPEININKLLKKAFRQGYFTSKFNINSYPKRFIILSEPSFNVSTSFFLYRKLYQWFFSLGSYVGVNK